jgi:membrane-bound metal-dependent hydrolase YbcI (DUF457 family)
MDIVTHAMMGVIIASPLVPEAPLTASCFMLGSVLPDLDVICRCFGKRAFMLCHQTYSHAFFTILTVTILAKLAIPSSFNEPWAALALGAGMLLHSLTDATNTYGIALFLPFSRKRFCLEWVFFIDATVILASAICAALVARKWMKSDFSTAPIAGLYVAFLTAYWFIKFLLRHQARKRCPDGILSLLPSALLPWHFFGCCRKGNEVRLLKVNLLNASVQIEETILVLDDEFAPKLSGISEFSVMRELSAAYHVIEAQKDAEKTQIRCRDLRTRNFKTRFGGLDVTLGPTGNVMEVTFHV